MHILTGLDLSAMPAASLPTSRSCLSGDVLLSPPGLVPQHFLLLLGLPVVRLLTDHLDISIDHLIRVLLLCGPVNMGLHDDDVGN